MANPGNSTNSFNGQNILPIVMSPSSIQGASVRKAEASGHTPNSPNGPRRSSRHTDPRSPLAWFDNLPLGRKQLVAMAVCGLLPALGLGVGSVVVLVTSLRAQLVEQAKSEVTVTEANYNVKINQMGFGSRGQADNTAIIDLALDYKQTGNVASSDRQQVVKEILKNEVRARRMEYATLVGRDLKIVVNANADRTGETFDPGNLVSQLFKDNDLKQLKASMLVEWKELAKERLDMTPDASGRDSLIRYVVTAVKDPATGEALGALVFADLVVGKKPIMENTLKQLNGGYSAIYLRQPNGQYVLETSLSQGNLADIKQAVPRIELPNPALLRRAEKTLGRPEAERMDINGRTYTVAAKAVPNLITETPDAPIPNYLEGAPPAILVRGTPEDGLNALLSRSVGTQAVILAIGLGAILAWTRIFRRTVLRPLQALEKTTQNFADGDRNQRAEVFYTDELGQLTTTFNRMADSIASSEQELADAAQQAELVKEITLRIRRSLSRESILETAVQEIRQVLSCDRVIVYSFDPNWAGTIVAEAVAPGCGKILGEFVNDPLRIELIEQFKSGRARAMNDIFEQTFNRSHQDILEGFQIRASIVAPIMQGGALVGLIAAHECTGARQWRPSEVDMFGQLATQIGYTLDQAGILSERELALQAAAERESARQSAEAFADEQRLQNQSLQQQLLTLLTDVEGAAMGDLTVRADVTAGEIGIVADFFNSIVESLRSIVTQVKTSALQVNTSLGENEQSIRQLADIAMKQADKTTQTLNTLEEMTHSIQSVADSATKTASVTRTATQTAAASGAAMDLTVRNILSLRETIGETTKKVKRLGESSQQISRAVSLINQIAMQTNLLAINAGIEAARAGEEGQGFAVIAEEVGDLAARSSAATREIEQLVDAIQRETASVVGAMEEGTTQVVAGTRSVEEAKHSINHILQVSVQIDQLVQSISDATVSQVKTSRTISDLMEEVALASGRTSQSSTQASNALRQTVEIAKELQTSVETFKVG
jgi:twitching motility protein PilJ